MAVPQERPTRRWMLRGLVTGLGAATVLPATLSAPKKASAGPWTTPVRAEEYFDRVMTDRGLHTSEAGEQWSWVVNYHIQGFTLGYEAYRDVAWLDKAVEFYDFALSRLQRAPDGYLGWIGPYIYDDTLWTDVHIGDALVFNPMLRFAQIVLGDRALRRRSGAAARRYVRLAQRHLMEKWEARGTWRDDGPYGYVDYWDHFLEPGDFRRFFVRGDAPFANSSQQFNKQMDMGIAALRLHQLTGDERYLRRATQVFATHKSHLQLFDDHYVWNFRDPLGQHDVVDVDTGELVSWVAVHPTNAGYQDREVHSIVEAYNAGVVYTEEDIRRLVTTNLTVMWNGDLESPAFSGSDTAIMPADATPAAGTLWTALVQFDATARALRARQLAQGGVGDPRDRIAYHHFENVVRPNPPSYDRTTPIDGAQTFGFPFSSVRSLTLATVLPSTIEHHDVAILAVKSIVPGKVRTSVHSADGRHELALLDERHVDGGPDVTFAWDGTDTSGARLPRGEYRVRFALAGDGHREFPITIA